MSNSISLAFLKAQIQRLNIVTGSPVEPYVRVGDKFVCQIGNYHLSGAYGGYALHRMGNDGGGISDVFRSGHVSKRELSTRISSMLAGIDAVYVEDILHEMDVFTR